MTKVTVRETDNQPENTKEIPVYYDQTRANYAVLFAWIKSAMREFEGKYQIDIPLAEYLAYSLSKEIPEQVKLANTKPIPEEKDVFGVTANVPHIGCLALIAAFIGLLIYFGFFA